MKIPIQTLKNDKFDLEVEDEASSILDVKKLLAPKLDLDAEEDVGRMKLIYLGKILKDNVVLKDIELKEKAFFVVMVSRARKKKKSTKAEETPVQPEAQVQAQPEAQVEDQVQPEIQPQDDGENKEPEPQASEAEPSESADSTESNVQPNELMSAQLVQMGYPKKDVDKALSESNNDIDAALQTLISGSSAPAVGGGGLGGGVNAGIAGIAGANPMAALLSNPQVLMQMLAQDPQIQQMAQQDPNIIPTLLSNPQFMAQLMAGMNQAMDNGGDGDNNVDGLGQAGPQGQNPPPGAIQVTPEEKADIDEIISITQMPEGEVVQVYFACGKNKEMTINMLFS